MRSHRLLKRKLKSKNLVNWNYDFAVKVNYAIIANYQHLYAFLLKIFIIIVMKLEINKWIY